QPTESRQGGNSGLERAFGTNTIEYETRACAGSDVPYLLRSACVTGDRTVCAVLLGKFQMRLVVVHRDDSSSAECPKELNTQQPKTADANHHSGGAGHKHRQGRLDGGLAPKAAIR